MIICCSFIANHDELDTREREMANMWLNAWDNCSREFKMQKLKGFNMAAM